MSANLDQSEIDCINKMYNNLNNKARGYAVGAENAQIDQLADELDSELLIMVEEMELAIYQKTDGRLIAVGHSNGPWAVDIPAVTP